AGTTTVGILLNNLGEVDVTGGTLSLAGGTIQNGGGTLRGGVWVVSHATLDMPGDIQIVDSNVHTEVKLVGADASFPAFEHVEQFAPVNTDSTLTLSGGRAFTFGSLFTVGTLVIDNPGTTVLGKNLSIAFLNVAQGLTRWTGGGSVSNAD